MTRHGYLIEHLTAWSLCAAIFAAMVIASPGGEAAATRDPALASAPFSGLVGAREARGQRWQPSPRLAGVPASMEADMADGTIDDRPFWDLATPPVTARMAGAEGGPLCSMRAIHPACPEGSGPLGASLAC